MNPFELIPTGIEGCFEIRPRIFQDQRGRFVKLFHRDFFDDLGLQSVYEEEYYSVSPARVIRGLHFQIPPKEHVKLVSCLKGSILDVVYDLRTESKTYGQVFSLELSSERGNMLYVPEGLAHGFYVLSESAIFLSMNSKKFSQECDRGIRWNSIPFDWPDRDPIVSEKDMNMVPLKEFDNPF
ncbi:MAG: dTDP-4-dehydrorhamnose 3,5-epimerase family protein [Bacteroidales bacterium]